MFYAFAGVFILNFFLYMTYFFFGHDLPASEIILLEGKVAGEPYPLYGFALCIIPALVTFFSCAISSKLRGMYHSCMANLIGVILAGIVSASFLPVSIPSSLCYFLFGAYLGIITVIRHPSFPSAVIAEFTKKIDSEMLASLLQLAHNRLSLLVEESIWVLGTFVVAAAVVFFGYLSNIAGPIMSSIPSLRSFYQLQAVFFVGFLLYTCGGYLGSVSLWLYLEAVFVESRYWKIALAPSGQRRRH